MAPSKLFSNQEMPYIFMGFISSFGKENIMEIKTQKYLRLLMICGMAASILSMYFQISPAFFGIAEIIVLAA